MFQTSQEDDMDIIGGVIVAGKARFMKLARIFQIILKTASLEQSNSEAMGYGETSRAPGYSGRRLKAWRRDG